MDDEIKPFVKEEKDAAALEHLKNNPNIVLGLQKIFKNLCRQCRSKVIRNFRAGKNTKFDEYCERCRNMAEEVYDEYN